MPTGGRTGHETVIVELSEVVRSVRRGPDPDEPLVRAGKGVGWEEPAGGRLPPPVVSRLSERPAPGLTFSGGNAAPVVAVGGLAADPSDGGPRPGVASAGRALGGSQPRGPGLAVAAPATPTTALDDERVFTRRHLVLLGGGLVLFVASLALAMKFLLGSNLVGGGIAVEAGAPPVLGAGADRHGAGSSEPATPLTVMPADAPRAPLPAAAPPPARDAERPLPPPSRVKGEILEPDADPVERRPPAPSSSPVAPAPEAAQSAVKAPGKSSASKGLTITFEPGFTSGRILINCHGDAPLGTDLRPPRTLVTVPPDCSVSVKCAGGQVVKASALAKASQAICGGCTFEDNQPSCRPL